MWVSCQLGLVTFAALAEADFYFGEHACECFTRTVETQRVCAYFRLECRVEVREEGVLPGEGQHSFLDHGTLHIIIHEDDILLQNLDSKVLPLPLQLCKQHLRCHRLSVSASSPVSWSTIIANYNQNDEI